MKATINFSCEFEDIPPTIADLLESLHNRQATEVDNLFVSAKEKCESGLTSEALTEIDNLRKRLSQIDQRLLDCSGILSGYIKADADLKSGVLPTPPPIEELIDNTENQEDDQIN